MTHVSSRFCRRSPRWLYIIPPYLTICALLTPRLLDARGGAMRFAHSALRGTGHVYEPCGRT